MSRLRRLAFWRRRDELPVVELRRSRPLMAGVVLVVLIAIGAYFAFTEKVPFTHGYILKAEFTSAQNIAIKSPVRTAGVPVGAVTSVQRSGRTGMVTMEIEAQGLPIHSDATLKIRPRLFLEGNWFVELRPGTPSAPTLSSESVIPSTQTADPVQIYQVINALNTDTRANLQHFLEGYGEALTHKPTTAEDVTQAPEAKGRSAAEALNDAALHAPAALRGSAVVNQALAGVEVHDLSKLIKAIGKVTAALNVHEQALGEWVGNFERFFGAFAAQSQSLKAAVAELPGSLHSITKSFAALRRASPRIRAFSRQLTPGVAQTGSTIAAALPWIAEIRAVLRPEKLGGVAKGLSEASPSLASLIGGQKSFFAQDEAFSKCLSKVFFPAGDAKLQDGGATSGAEAYKEFWYLMTGLAGIGQNFDGNGAFTRFLAGGGGHTLVSQPTEIVGVKAKGSPLIGHATLAPEGTRPRFPKSEPPYRPLVRCASQQVPSFNGPLAQGPADGSGG